MREVWHDPKKELPRISKRHMSCSVNVRIKLRDGSVVVGYYIHSDNNPCWKRYTHTMPEIPVEEVVAWRSM